MDKMIGINGENVIEKNGGTAPCDLKLSMGAVGFGDTSNTGLGVGHPPGFSQPPSQSDDAGVQAVTRQVRPQPHFTYPTTMQPTQEYMFKPPQSKGQPGLGITPMHKNLPTPFCTSGIDRPILAILNDQIDPTVQYEYSERDAPVCETIEHLYTSEPSSNGPPNVLWTNRRNDIGVTDAQFVPKSTVNNGKSDGTGWKTVMFDESVEEKEKHDGKPKFKFIGKLKFKTYSDPYDHLPDSPAHPSTEEKPNLNHLMDLAKESNEKLTKIDPREIEKVKAVDTSSPRKSWDEIDEKIKKAENERKFFTPSKIEAIMDCQVSPMDIYPKQLQLSKEELSENEKKQSMKDRKIFQRMAQRDKWIDSKMNPRAYVKGMFGSQSPPSPPSISK